MATQPYENICETDWNTQTKEDWDNSGVKQLEAQSSRKTRATYLDYSENLNDHDDDD